MEEGIAYINSRGLKGSFVCPRKGSSVEMKIEYLFLGHSTERNGSEGEGRREVLLLPGEEESMMKYAECIRWLHNDLGCVVWAMDHRGQGLSSRWQSIPSHHISIDSVDTYVNDIHHLLTSIRPSVGGKGGAGSPVNIIGHRMAGMVSSLFALKFPSLVNVMILSSPAFACPYKGPQSSLEEIITKAQDIFDGSYNPSTDYPYYDTLERLTRCSHSASRYMDWVHLQEKFPSIITTKPTKDFLKAYSAGVVRVREEGNAITCPVLILQGGSDDGDIKEAQGVFHRSKVASRFLRVYQEGGRDLLLETNDIVQDVRQTVSLFLCGKAPASSISYFPSSSAEADSQPSSKKSDGSLTTKETSSVSPFTVDVEALIMPTVNKTQKLLTLADFRDKSWKLIQYICKLLAHMNKLKTISLPKGTIDRINAFLSMASTSRRFLWCGRLISFPGDIKSALEEQTLLERIVCVISALFGLVINAQEDLVTLIKFGVLKKGLIGEKEELLASRLWFATCFVDLYYSWASLLHLKTTKRQLLYRASLQLQDYRSLLPGGEVVMKTQELIKKMNDLEHKLYIQRLSNLKVMFDSIFAGIDALELTGVPCEYIYILTGLGSAVCGFLKHIQK